jgi:hypothetical protein
MIKKEEELSPVFGVTRYSFRCWRLAVIEGYAHASHHLMKRREAVAVAHFRELCTVVTGGIADDGVEGASDHLAVVGAASDRVAVVEAASDRVAIAEAASDPVAVVEAADPCCSPEVPRIPIWVSCGLNLFQFGCIVYKIQSNLE